MAQIKLKHIYADKDRHGNIRYYFFKRGMGKKLRIRGTPGSDEFMVAYAAALAGRPPPDQILSIVSAPTLARPAGGTFYWLCAQYYQSAEFKSLAANTQKKKRILLRSICAEPLAPGSLNAIGDLPYAEMTSRAVRMLRDRKAETPSSANEWVIQIRTLFNWAIQAEYASENPAIKIPKIKIVSDGHHTWTPDEIRQYETTHPLGTPARLALALLAYTGQRRSDVIRLGRQHVTTNNTLKFTQKKNETRKPVIVEIPILPQLSTAIRAIPKENLTFLVTSKSRPFSADGFGARFREWCNIAGLTHCTAHGLRKAAACLAAENGATEMELMAIFGWQDANMAQLYTRKAKRTKLAQRATYLLNDDPNKDETNVSHF